MGFKRYCSDLISDLLIRSHFSIQEQDNFAFTIATSGEKSLLLFLHNGDTECAINPQLEIRVSYFDLVSLYLILLGTWGNPYFFSSVGNTDSLPSIKNDESVPVGFEIEEQIFAMEKKSEFDEGMIKIGDWAIQTQAKMCKLRKAALQCSFESGLASLVLHEIGHLELGHAIHRLKHSKLTGRSSPTNFPYTGCEISADRFSALNVIRDQTIASKKTKLSSMGQICVFTGVVATYLRLHGAIELRNLSSSERDKSHPPVWFRCYDLQLVSQSLTGIDSNNLSGSLGELAKLHPLIGSLLHPIRDNEIAKHHADFEKTSLDCMVPYSDIFNSNRICFIRC